MNWTPRINRIVATVFPFEGRCLWQRQLTLRARMERTDRIKRLIAGKPVEEQNEILTEIEEKYAISKEEDRAN